MDPYEDGFYEPNFIRMANRPPTEESNIITKCFFLWESPDEFVRLEKGDKVMLPESFLNELYAKEIVSVDKPVIFRIEKKQFVTEEMLRKLGEEKEEYSTRILEIYLNRAPEKIGNVEGLVEKHQHQLHDFYLLLCKRYGLPEENIQEPLFPQNETSDLIGMLSRPALKRMETEALPQMRAQSLLVGVDTKCSASEEIVYAPRWIFRSLGLKQGDTVELTTVPELPSAKYAHFISMEPGFLKIIENIGQEAFLEEALSHHTALSLHQTIKVSWSGKFFNLFVKDLKPASEVCVMGMALEMGADIEPADPDANVYDVSEIEEIRENDKMPMDLEEQNQMAEILRQQLEMNKAEEMAAEFAKTEFMIKKSSILSASEPSEMEEKEIVIAGSDQFICETCGRAINLMSKMMHEMNCARNFIRCKVCGEGCQKREVKTHMEAFHEVQECVCGLEFEGTRALSKHRYGECELRIATCPYCHKDFTSQILNSHEKSCGAVETACYKCSNKYPRNARNEHLCTRRCNFCMCQVPFEELLLHKITDCPQRRANCKYCKYPHLVTELLSHEDWCGSKSVPCEKCNKLTTFKNYQEHLNSGCNFHLINQKPTAVELETTACPDCQRKVPIDNLPYHMMNECSGVTSAPSGISGMFGTVGSFLGEERSTRFQTRPKFNDDISPEELAQIAKMEAVGIPVDNISSKPAAIPSFEASSAPPMISPASEQRCPLCNKRVLTKNINEHMDFGCYVHVIGE